MKIELENTLIQMQCVEYARRWLCNNRQFVFSDVVIAADIWDKIIFYTHFENGSQCPVSSVLNGAPTPPKIGDLIIYSQEFLETGHVAVTTNIDVQAGFISVSEQNYCNQYQAPNHIRHIPLIRNSNHYWLLDKYLIGWKQIQEAETE